MTKLREGDKIKFKASGINKGALTVNEKRMVEAQPRRAIIMGEKTATTKADQLRALREARYERGQQQQKRRHVADPGVAHPDNSDSPAWATPSPARKPAKKKAAKKKAKRSKR